MLRKRGAAGRLQWVFPSLKYYLKIRINQVFICLFTNLINGKRYIGFSGNLARRFREYFNTNYLLKNNSMYICNSLLKHDYPNFSLTILENCEPVFNKRETLLGSIVS
jgi:group I intron endonuclease